MAEDNWWADAPFATASSAKAHGSGNGGKAGNPKSYAEDRKNLIAASTTAQKERDLMRSYAEAEKAVETFGTDPDRAALVDALTPGPEDGWYSLPGNLLGSVARVVGHHTGRGPFSDQSMEARDTLNTIRANNQINSARALGANPTDRDAAIIRLAGVDTGKSVAENKRIIRNAKFDSGLEQVRAGVKAKWIGKFGSLSSAAPNGLTSEAVLLAAERNYRDEMSGRVKSSLPRPPRSVMSKSNANSGWSVREIK